jgi:predicted small secreted protein
MLIAVVMALTISCVFAGCHTIHGAGEDIESGGEAIQRATD